MRINTRRRIYSAAAAICLLLTAGLVFVFYSMHAVYEPDTIIDAADVPVPVMSSFKGLHPAAKEVTWEFEDGLYAAVFNLTADRLSETYFSPGGQVVRTEVSIGFADLPKPAQDYLLAKEGFEVNELERIEETGAAVTYEVEIVSTLSEWDVIFDAEGHLLTTERDGSTLE